MGDSLKKIDLDPQTSEHSGALGFYETTFRRFKSATTLLTLLPMYVLASVCLGLALTPSILLVGEGLKLVSEWSSAFQAFALGFLLALGYFVFGLSLVLVVPAFNFMLRAYPTPWRGPYYSLSSVRWAVHNGLTYLVRYLFIEFATPTPINLLFLRLMGMKIGHATQINTSNISDPCLLEIGHHTTIGGSVTIVAHYGQGGYLVIAPVKIGNYVTVGLKATIMGDVEIGDRAKILSNSAVMPKTRIGPGETWGGVPARRLDP